ncbi:multicopper oxidase type 1, secreted [Favolaschia claudopus]|uniref:Multicopper oxidase type 1, secreted n=1 Tax=Favolaschia claudopus TaxID=2862362 RepID=A0AAW0EL38_9AGAR
MVPLRHIPPLFVAFALTFGGLYPFFDAPGAIREFGLPNHVATSSPAQSVMKLSSARGSAIGLALFAFYLRKQYAAFDTVLASLFYVGLVDGYVCWQEGVPGKALFRFCSGLIIGGWGFLGLTT